MLWLVLRLRICLEDVNEFNIEMMICDVVQFERMNANENESDLQHTCFKT